MADPRRRWSLRIGKLFGISIRVHVTLLALLAFLAIVAPIAGVGLKQSFAQWFLVVAVFGCILVHELVHALVARRFGCVTHEILLLPIGGIAKLERIPERPAHELLVAIAGPLTNIVIAAMLGGVIALAGWPLAVEPPSLLGAIVVPLFWANIALAGFNLLPAFPMDGGRVLRAALASRMDRARATRVAAGVGKVLAVLFVIVGFSYGGVLLSIIGLFIWFSASQESAMSTISSVLSRGTVADAMVRTTHVVDAATSLETAARQMLAEGHRELVVAEGGRVTGVVTVADLADGMGRADSGGNIGGVMHRDLPIVSPMLSLDAVVLPLEQRGIVLVGDDDVVIGMLTADQLASFAALHV